MTSARLVSTSKEIPSRLKATGESGSLLSERLESVMVGEGESSTAVLGVVIGLTIGLMGGVSWAGTHPSILAVWRQRRQILR